MNLFKRKKSRQEKIADADLEKQLRQPVTRNLMIY